MRRAGVPGGHGDDLGRANTDYRLHDLRILSQNLLANPNCSDEHAKKIGDFLDKVNNVSHVPSSGFKIGDIHRDSS